MKAGQWSLGRAFFILAAVSVGLSFLRNPWPLSYHFAISFFSICVVIQMLRRAWRTEFADAPSDAIHSEPEENDIGHPPEA